MRRGILFSILLMGVILRSSGQISFPSGPVLRLNTDNDFLYLETRLIFHTGNYKADDYRWEKVMDSLDSRWLVTACFNGDCKDDLLQSGNFIKDFGLNDTTCFIAFHVETHKLPGTSVIKYNIYNTKNPADSAQISYYITYTLPSGIENIHEKEFRVYPNPSSDVVFLENENHSGEAIVTIFDMRGKVVSSEKTELTESTRLDVSKLDNGIYFLQVKTGKAWYRQRIIKQ